MPYSGYRAASCPAAELSAVSASSAIVLPALGAALKSIVMRLTPARDTWSPSIDLITDRALSCSPDGSTGTVSPEWFTQNQKTASPGQKYHW